MNSPLFLIAVVLALLPGHSLAESDCFGTLSNGRIVNSVKLPTSGPNFSVYSLIGAAAGRTHVHSKVAEIVVTAYSALQTQSPGTVFVYGETGWPSGGRLWPHRTHQNGLSVDFFVPVRNAHGESVALPTGITDRFGYDIEFDSQAKYGDYSIDFTAIAEHLYQLHRAAQKRGSGITQVIFDTAFLDKLFAAPRGLYLKENIAFMKAKPWVRHDEHYHVDFAVRCKTKK